MNVYNCEKWRKERKEEKKWEGRRDRLKTRDSRADWLTTSGPAGGGLSAETTFLKLQTFL